LREAGYSEFFLEQLAAVRQSAAFRELRDLKAGYIAWGKQPKEFIERYRDLFDRGGSGRARLSLTMPGRLVRASRRFNLLISAR